MDSFFIKHFQSDKTFPANSFLLKGKKSGRELTLLVPNQRLDSDVKKKKKKKILIEVTLVPYGNRGRVVKASDSKSDSLWERRFESCRLRQFHRLFYRTQSHNNCEAMFNMFRVTWPRHGKSGWPSGLRREI